MIFGNLSNGMQIFAGTNVDGTWTPDKKYALVEINEGNTATHTYTYALYKVSFENPNTGEFDEPEWRLYGEGKIDVIDSNILYTYNDISPEITISDADGENPLYSYIPYIATYATEAEGKEALAQTVPKLGCRDPAANNYDHTATMDDGNCGYDTPAEKKTTQYLLMGAVAVGAFIILG